MTEAIAKLSYTHQALIDLIVAEPHLAQRELAKRFGYTEGWLSQIMSSDAFREQLAVRRAEIVNPLLVATVEEKFRAVADRSLSLLIEKLDKPEISVPDNLVVKAVEMSAKALEVGGFGTKAPPPPPAAPTLDHLEVLAQNLLNLRRKAEVQVGGVTVELADGAD